MNIEKPSLEILIQDKNFLRMVHLLSDKVRRSSYRFAQSHPVVSRQDLISEGIAAACSAYKNFDPAKGAWNSYTYMYVRNAMQVFSKKFCHQLSISERDSREHLEEMTSIGVIRIDQMTYEKGDDETKFDIPGCSGVEVPEFNEAFYFKGSSDLEISMFKDHIIEDKTLQEIAIKYKTSKSNVYNTIQRMSLRIKERVQVYEQENADSLSKLWQD